MTNKKSVTELLLDERMIKELNDNSNLREQLIKNFNESSKVIYNIFGNINALRERIKKFESMMLEFVKIDVDGWEEYELKYLIKLYIGCFKNFLQENCKIDNLSSRVCEHGTKSCIIDHKESK